nr:zinc ABC transporter substrate-binding protein [Nitratireductor aquibiodomus]
MKFLRTLICAIGLTSVSLVPAASAEDGKLGVVATFSIIGDFARVVGGDRIELRTLVGADSDAHVYEPRPADAIALARADVVLTNGLLFEASWNDWSRRAARPPRRPC